MIKDLLKVHNFTGEIKKNSIKDSVIFMIVKWFSNRPHERKIHA